MIEYDKDAIVNPEISTYIRQTLSPNDDFLTSLETYAAENSVPIILSETAALIKTIILSTQPKSILEIGCAIGYSSILMARYAQRAKIKTLEYSDEMVEIATKNISDAGLDKRIEVIHTDARTYLPYLDKDEQFDIIFLDGPKSHYTNMLDECIRLLKPHGMLIADNILFKGMVGEEDLVQKRKLTIVKKLNDFLFRICHDNRIESSILPIGDGVSISIKKRG